MRDYKTKEDLELVIKLNKPENVVRLFFTLYKQGEAFNEFVGSLKEKYEEEYKDCVDCFEYIDVEKQTIFDDVGSETEKEIFVFPNEYYEVDEEGNKVLKEEVQKAIDEGKIKPSFDLFKNQQIEQYQDIEVTEEDFKKFYAPYAIEKLNKERDENLKHIVVTVNDVPFDGDEVSQTRMARAISILDDNEKMWWVCADNKAREVTKENLKQALKLAGLKQTEIWNKYKQLKDEWSEYVS